MGGDGMMGILSGLVTSPHSRSVRLLRHPFGSFPLWPDHRASQLVWTHQETMGGCCVECVPVTWRVGAVVCVGCWMLLVVVGCRWMWLDVVRCCWVVGCRWMSLDVPGCCSVIGCCWMSSDVVEWRCMLLDAVGCHWMLLDVIGCRWMLLDIAGCCWMSLDVVGCCLTSLDVVGCH